MDESGLGWMWEMRLARQSEDGNEILVGWSDIARYMGRGVRTVQRWHEELGLPITRPAQPRKGVVIARRSHLDLWLRALPLREQEAQKNGPGGVR